jgi:hypothetical protein
VGGQIGGLNPTKKTNVDEKQNITNHHINHTYTPPPAIPGQKYISDFQIMISFSDTDNYPKISAKIHTQMAQRVGHGCYLKEIDRRMEPCHVHGVDLQHVLTQSAMMVQWFAFTNDYPKP